jgi:hypothetical protein
MDARRAANQFSRFLGAYRAAKKGKLSTWGKRQVGYVLIGKATARIMNRIR